MRWRVGEEHIVVDLLPFVTPAATLSRQLWSDFAAVFGEVMVVFQHGHDIIVS